MSRHFLIGAGMGLTALFGVLGFSMLVWGSYQGLFVVPAAPPPPMGMGETVRILFVHVPAAWNALLFFLFSALLSVAHLVTGRPRLDAANEATLEVGLLLTALLLALGMLWAKPTWNVYWNWDPRLTSCAVLGLSFAGVLIMRSMVDDPTRRATWTSVLSILAFVNVPIVYMSVRWWRSLHQVHSSPETMSPLYQAPLRVNALGIFLLALALLALRYLLAWSRLALEHKGPDVDDDEEDHDLGADEAMVVSSMIFGFLGMHRLARTLMGVGVIGAISRALGIPPISGYIAAILLAAVAFQFAVYGMLPANVRNPFVMLSYGLTVNALLGYFLHLLWRLRSAASVSSPKGNEP